MVVKRSFEATLIVLFAVALSLCSCGRRLELSKEEALSALSNVQELRKQNYLGFTFTRGNTIWDLVTMEIRNGDLKPKYPGERSQIYFVASGDTSNIHWCDLEFDFRNTCEFVLADSAIGPIDEVLIDSAGQTAEVSFTMHWVPRAVVVDAIFHEYPKLVEDQELGKVWRKVAHFRHFDQGGWRLRELD